MRRRTAVLAFAAVLVASDGPFAQSGSPTSSGYLTPPKGIVDIMTVDPQPGVIVSPARDTIAVTPGYGMPGIAEVAQPMLRLAGMRIDPRTNGPHRTQPGKGIILHAIGTAGPSPAAGRPLALPPGAKVGSVAFSPDGKRLSFTNTRDTGIDLYIADVTTAQVRLVPGAAINGIGSGCSWLEDSSALLCGVVPSGRGPAPAVPKIPNGPNIQETSGTPGPVATYEDMLTSPHDEDLFEYYLTSQLAFVDAATGKWTTVGKPATISSAAASPNGQFILVEKVKRPFSRLVPWRDFPEDVEIWSRAGTRTRTIADVPMGDTVPINGVTTGPRAYRWSPVDPATVVWVEALDKGDLRNAVPQRDRIMVLKAPFTGEPAETARTEYRYTSAMWTDSGTILLSEADRKTRTTRTWVLTSSWGEPRKLWDRKQQDAYANPGSPMMRPGKGTILQAGDYIYLAGQGASKEGDRPFLDKVSLKTLATERLFRSDGKSYETVVGLMGDDGKRVLTRYETASEPPNYYVRELPAASKQAITQFKDPHPQITAAERMFVTYTRKDGVGLSGTIYLPLGYQRGQRVPMLVWAYPREFVDAGAASQVAGSANRFLTVGGASHLLLLSQGYAVFDGATMPIVGAGETANDTYVEQLVASAQAAVDKAVELGIADRGRVAVGGHSYGAFMTANLLAHSDIFAAGIARSGAYNRTLTPFGFQNESRTFWEVQDIYGRMSPFFHANKINEPILLVHGEADDNSGTFPIQSERLYMALKGHGATVRYVTLPHEAHGYAARESNRHVVAEMLNWLEKHVKNGSRRIPTSSAGR